VSADRSLNLCRRRHCFCSAYSGAAVSDPRWLGARESTHWRRCGQISYRHFSIPRIPAISSMWTGEERANQYGRPVTLTIWPSRGCVWCGHGRELVLTRMRVRAPIAVALGSAVKAETRDAMFLVSLPLRRDGDAYTIGLDLDHALPVVGAARCNPRLSREPIGRDLRAHGRRISGILPLSANQKRSRCIRKRRPPPSLALSWCGEFESRVA